MQPIIVDCGNFRSLRKGRADDRTPRDSIKEAATHRRIKGFWQKPDSLRGCVALIHSRREASRTTQSLVVIHSNRQGRRLTFAIRLRLPFACKKATYLRRGHTSDARPIRLSARATDGTGRTLSNSARLSRLDADTPPRHGDRKRTRDGRHGKHERRRKGYDTETCR